MEPETQKQNNFYRYLFVGAAVTAIIAAVVAYLVGANVGSKVAPPEEVRKLQEKIEEQQKVLDVYFPALPDTIFALTGEVKEIGDNEIKIEHVLKQRYQIPGEPAQKEIATIFITENTKIMAAFAGGVREASRDDIKIGSVITATSAENIKGKTKFEAAQITLRPASAPTGTVPGEQIPVTPPPTPITIPAPAE